LTCEQSGTPPASGRRYFNFALKKVRQATADTTDFMSVENQL
jgi:hypothetical protein